MGRWNEQQCLLTPNTELDTTSGTANNAVTDDWKAGGTSGTARKVDTVQTGWVNTEFSERIFFKFIVKNELQNGDSTLTIRDQDAKTIYAEVAIFSVYGREVLEISRLPVQYIYGDQSVAYTEQSTPGTGYANTYTADLGTFTDPTTVVGIPALNTTSTSGTPKEIVFFTGFSPNTPGAIMRGENSGSPPVNSLGSTTYAELDLFYHYDNRRPGSAKENSGARINSAFFGELNGSDVGEDTVAEGTKLQAKLKVVNCFAFTSNDYR